LAFYAPSSGQTHTLVNDEIILKGAGVMNEEKTMFPNDPVVAMAYVPWQLLEDAYEPEVALRHGTLFPELYKPFTAGGRCCRG
jgi:hypothetical protein